MLGYWTEAYQITSLFCIDMLFYSIPYVQVVHTVCWSSVSLYLRMLYYRLLTCIRTFIFSTYVGAALPPLTKSDRRW